MRKALVLSFALILGLGFAAFAQGELHGEWWTQITIDPTATDIATFIDFATEITVEYSVGGWTFTSWSSFDDSGWAEQLFSAGGAFGAFTLDSELRFAPLGGQFIHWDTSASFTFGAVDIGMEFVLVPSDVLLEITAAATTGLVDIDFILDLGDVTQSYCGDPWYVWYAGDGFCDFDFNGIYIDVEFPFCCADIHMDLDFTCSGFQKVCFTTKGITVPNLPWLGIDAKVCFQTDSKKITLYPSIDFGVDVCFEIYMSLLDTSDNPIGYYFNNLKTTKIGGFSVDGIALSCEIGGVSFEGVSYWGPGFVDWGEYYCGNPYMYKPGILGDYLADATTWEAYRISTTEDACCGPFDFDLTFFFDSGSGYLFDVSAVDTEFSYELGENFTVELGFEYVATAPGLTLLQFGFDITW
jgi:hypothetical protein